jgi:filamentous hemagglutinin family protein
VYRSNPVLVASQYVHSWLYRRVSLGGSIFLGIQLMACPASAQVVPDGTVLTEVNTVGQSVEIMGGIQRGGNLFHSFEMFSVRNNEIADFQLPTGTTVENIISRVTGDSVSNINGTLKAEGNANLFLINPNGIIFGPNATLDIGGSFLGTTARSMMFADGTIFSATPPQGVPLLTMSIPVGLQFGLTPGAITNQSSATPVSDISPSGLTTSGLPVGLQVRPNNTLALVGGNIIFEGGFLHTPQGQIELGSVSSHSLVGLVEMNQGWTLDYDRVDTFQDIRLGPSVFFPLSSLNASGTGGAVRLRGRHIALVNTLIFNVTTGAGDGGDLNVFATDSVEIDRSLLSSQVGLGISGDSSPVVTGSGGDILIETQKFFMRGGVITSGTLSQGQAGDVTINASELIDISGGLLIPGEVPTLSSLSAATDGSGAGGVLTISTPQLTIREGAEVVVTSSGSGAAGTLNITSDRLTLDQGLLTAQTEVSNSGNVSLQVSDLLLLRNNSQITARAGGAGNGGNITIDAGLVFAIPNQDSNIIANASEGNGGNITINTQGLFGLAERQALPGNGTNDIDASSEFGLAGGVQIDTLVSDPDSALVNLPEGVRDPSQHIAMGCAAKQGSRFVLAGRGGVPPSPQDLVSNPQLWKDVRDLSTFRTSQQRTSQQRSYRSPGDAEPVIQAPILEATGWQRDGQGQTRLVNDQPNLTSASLEPAVRTC